MIRIGENKMHGSRLRYFLKLITFSIFGVLAFGKYAMADDKRQTNDPALIKVAITEPSAKAIAFHEGGHWVWAGSQLFSMVIPLIILITPIGQKIEKLAWAYGHGRVRAVILFVIMVMILSYFLRLPWSYRAGFVRLKDYGLSNQTVWGWLSDSMKSLAVMIVIQSLVAAIVWGILIDKLPKTWWFWTAAGTTPFLVAGAFLTPLVIDPLFNTFGPMKNKVLEQEILELSGRTGVGGSRVFEVDKSRQTKAVNAYVTGLFGSKRIVLWDTLLQALPPREVKAVVAHELGHYVLGHVRWGVLLGGISSFGGLFILDRLIRCGIPRFGPYLHVNDPKSLTVMVMVVLLITVGELIFSPVSNLISRTMEHEADRFAIEMTHDPAAVAQAFSTLQKENLSVPFPSWFYRIWRATHPSIGERIEFANSYRPWISGDPEVYAGKYNSTQMSK
jgi:Zn-dependent protease with chaperone function